MGADASRGKICSYYLVEYVFSSFLYPDERGTRLLENSRREMRLLKNARRETRRPH